MSHHACRAVPSAIMLATGNAGKLREMRRLLAPLGCALPGQEEMGIKPANEPHLTFRKNALAKACHASKASGLPAIADDSGLCVAALDGAPGVYSARYAGDGADSSANNRKLLAAMAGEKERAACFCCAAVLWPGHGDGRQITGKGEWHGTVAKNSRGRAGFGYDPIFVTADGRTAAELGWREKDALSHRGQAIRAIVAALLGE